ncbi:probable transcription factor At5g28040 [Cynara cardunculus var. scolymus]|uniref:probable transcription factor At5g28040 n=1 Tax=Cynara cardunculus var. scolymus TaxID=59895 RepID=UPI000D631059|nr:probable transcription factor At5g28040 [Cynara cardunculus var. scolymus]
MDFTPPSNPIQQPSPISSIPSSAKLPIKRKTPASNLILAPPKLESTTHFADDDDARHPPFKFHRIWTEPDEIRFLQGLLDCSSQGLSFPRDLGMYYARFSHGMSQPYTKSQLSEKLRRLRKKFRVISSRLSKGLDKALLSPQDRALYDLSKQLWEPDLDRPSSPSAVTNFNSNPNNNYRYNSNLVGVKPSYSQTLPSSSMAVLALPSVIKKTNTRDNGNKGNNHGGGGGDDRKGDFNGDMKLSDMNAEMERNPQVVRNEVRVKSGNEARVKSGGDTSSGVVHFATKTLADVLDQSLKEIRMMIDLQGHSKLEKDMSFEKRWRDQHIAEFDAFAKRLKLIVEHSSVVSK